MQSIILIVHVLVAVAVIGLILLQQGRGADAGAAFGSGSAGSVFGSRGPATLLARLTTIFVTIFFLTSLSLAFLSGRAIDRRSVVERVAPMEVQESAAPAEGEGSAPATEEEVPALPRAPAGSDPDQE